MAIGPHGLVGMVASTVSGVTIDQASFEPVYRQLARILREQIQAGELHPGAALPSEAALSQTFGVGRDAVRDALASCAAKAWSSPPAASAPSSANQPPSHHPPQGEGTRSH